MASSTHNVRRLGWLLLPPALLVSGTAFAASNSDLAQRVDQLEHELAQLQAHQPDASASSNNTMIGNTRINIGGYVKFDAIYSDYSETAGGIPQGRGRAFYIPGVIPVGNASDHDSATDFQARETRVHLGTNTDFGEDSVKTYVEIDFYGEEFDANTGNGERLVNSADLRLRHAYLEWDTGDGNQWLFGQTWSNFMDLGAYPETLDFVGPAEGITFVRQAQVRWTHGGLSMSVENPQTTATKAGGARVSTDTSKLPDFTARYAMPLGNHNGHLSGSMLLRQLRADGPLSNDKTFAYGVSFSGRFNINSSNNLRFQANYGDGIGRYLGLNTANAAVIKANGSLDTITAWGGYVAFQHKWSKQWRSNLVYSQFSADNEHTALTGNGLTKESRSTHVNLIYQPLKPLSLGIEYIHTNREVESGLDGQLSRVQLSAKYAFNFSS